MKKLCCILLVLIITLTALTACKKGNMPAETTTATSTPVAPETSAEPATETLTEPSTEMPTEEKNPMDSKEQLANQFLKSLKDKNISKIVELIGANSEDKAAEAKILREYSFFKKVDIKKYKILDSYGEQFEVELTITKSSDSRFPVGTSRWIIEADAQKINNIGISLFKRANKALDIITWREQSDVVVFCNTFSLEFGCYETVNDFNNIVPKDKEKFDWFCDDMLRFTNTLDGSNKAKRTLLERRAKEMLGITGVNFKKSSHYDKATDSINLDFYGGCWRYSSLASEDFDPVSRRYTVVIDYYSDTAYILKAKKVRYTVQENKDDSLTLLSTVLLYDSGLDLSIGLGD